MANGARFATRAGLLGDLRQLSLRPGDAVMVHAAVRRVGPMLGGPDTLIAALRDAVGPRGTILAYTDWNADYEVLLDAHGRVPHEWREHIAPFDPVTSRATRDNGIFPEFLRTTPGALRSRNPGASVAALGAGAEWFTNDHPLDFGYGEGSPLAKLVAVDGKVLMLGAPLDTMTLLHHAEHLARIPGKKVKRVEVPLATPSGVQWRMVEEFDTSGPIMETLAPDYFADIVNAFVNEGRGITGRVGDAHCVLVHAAAITAFAVDWLERLVAQSSTRGATCRSGP